MQQLIGLTGGIGSGKSTLANELRKQGIPVYDSDSEAQRIISQDTDVRNELCALFGQNVYAGTLLDRPKVAQIVFRNPDLLQRMNAIVHPRVRTDVSEWVKRHNNARLLFVESAILYQSGFDSLCDKTVWVTAPEQVRIARVMQRDNATEADVRLRMARQGDETVFLHRADIVVNNDGFTAVPELAAELLRKLC